MSFAKGDMAEDIVGRLLEDIRSASRQILFGTDGTFTCFSDGRFLERADALPPAVAKLRDPFADPLPADAITALTPAKPEESGEIPQSIQKGGNRYELSCKNYTCLVDSVCYDYLKMRYPEARVYCLGRKKPAVFLQDRIVRAVLMPLRK